MGNSSRAAKMTAAVPVLALALAGCTGAPAPKPTPSYQSAALTATVMTMAEAADYYLDAVCPQNALITQYNDSIDTYNENPAGNSVLPVAELAGKIGKENRAQADALRNPPLPWPDIAADDIKKVASFNLTQVGPFQEAGKAKTITELDDAFVGATRKDSGAQAVRADLRLPTNTTASCYGHPGFEDKKPKTPSTTGPLTEGKVYGTYPAGFPKIVTVSSLPAYLRTHLAGTTQAVAVASGVYIGAKPGLTEQQVLDTQNIVGLCSDVTAYTKSFTEGAQYPGTCFTKVMVTPSPKA